ncbi:membrane protease subunit HflC [Dongia mobilis]|uniref:Protein HflC n=1 Tax=Dongia mobilis TaxID=578943 RepID=A0A4R6WJJ3_9PROT|nr:protease modulator HflC [Dongia mobilis]TDQ78854.1 membrane protease subunit HflC [Dongia mobilis]
MSQGKIVAIIVLLGAVLIGVYNSTYIVPQAETAIVLRFGNPQEVIEEPGLKFKVPIADQVTTFDRRVRNFEAPVAELPTRDQKYIVVSAFVRYRIKDSLTFFRVGRTFENAENQIQSVLLATLRSVIGNVPLTDTLTPKRADIMRQVKDELTRQAAEPYGIEIVDVRFKRVDLPVQNSEAVFNSMRTQRAQEAAGIRAEGAREAREKRAEADKERVVLVADARRQAEILRGEGDAEAISIYNEAFGRDPAFFDFYRSLQAMQQGLAGDTTTYVGPPAGDFFRFFGNQGDAQAQ